MPGSSGGWRDAHSLPLSLFTKEELRRTKARRSSGGGGGWDEVAATPLPERGTPPRGVPAVSLPRVCPGRGGGGLTQLFKGVVKSCAAS